MFLLHNPILEDRKSMLMGNWSKVLSSYDTGMQGLYGTTKKCFQIRKENSLRLPIEGNICLFIFLLSF